jgi:hypothetical protein
MSTGLVVGRIIPTPAAFWDEAAHRRLLAEAINHVAAATYTPETQLAARSNSLALTTSFATSGVDVTVTPFIPVRAHLLVLFHWGNNSGAAALNAQFRVKEDSTVLETVTLPILAASAVAESYPLQLLRDLEPNTTYVYSVEALEGAAEDGSVLTRTSLSVRLEHRRLDP